MSLTVENIDNPQVRCKDEIHKSRYYFTQRNSDDRFYSVFIEDDGSDVFDKEKKTVKLLYLQKHKNYVRNATIRKRC